MEPNRSIVDEDKHDGGNAEHEQDSRPDAPVEDDVPGDHSGFRGQCFNHYKSDQEDTEDDKQGDDAGITPSICRATPLKGQKHTDDARDNDQVAGKIQSLDDFQPRMTRCGRLHRLQDEDDDGQCDAADGEVDVETPSPADVGGEGAADKWADDGGHAHQGTDETNVHASFLQRSDGDQEDDGAVGDSGGTNTGNGATDDEGGGVRSSGTESGTDFEDDNVDKIDEFGRAIGVDSTHGHLHGTGRQHKCAAVPADIVQAVEVVGDGWNGGGDDGSI